MRRAYFQLLRSSFSLIVMKSNFDKEDEERREWERERERDGGKMGLILKRGKGRRSPPGLGFLKGACSLQGRCSLARSLALFFSLAPCTSSSSSPGTPATQDQLWLTSSLVQNSFKLLDLWVDITPLPSSSSLLTPTSHRLPNLRSCRGATWGIAAFTEVLAACRALLSQEDFQRLVRCLPVRVRMLR